MDKLPGNPLSMNESVNADWLIEQLGAELVRQDPVLGREFVPLGRMSQIAKGPVGVTKVFFGVRCECLTAAIVSFEAAQGKTKDQVLEVLPQSGRKLLEQRNAFVSMPCSAHERLRVDNFNRS